MKSPIKVSSILYSAMFGLFFSFFFESLQALKRMYYGVALQEGGSFGSFLSTFRIGEILLFFILFSIGAFFLLRHSAKVIPFVYRYRYCFAALFVILCVAFSVSGSSILCWESVIGSPKTGDSGLLLGTPRPVRSDEYNANTMMAFSQYYNQTGAFAYFANTFRGTETDMFIVYGQPVLDWAVIFRPFHWGYLIFDPGRGLAFFWSLRFAALFMVTFEMGMLITKNSKRLSLALAFLVSLAPVVQWWYSVNGFVEMLIYVQLAALVLRRYFQTEKYWQRCLYAVLAAWMAVSFVLLFYPAWQLPMLWVLVALIVWLALEARRHVHLSPKKDIPLLFLALVLIGGSLLYVLSKSGGTIEAVMNTAYPGIRLSTGGGDPASLFAYGTNIFLPLKEPSPDLYTNQVELSRFFDFFPIGLLLAVWVLVVEKQRDKLLYCLLAVDVLLIVFCCVPFPEWLAKATMLSQSYSGRVVAIVGFVNLLILFRAMSVIKKRFTSVWAIAVAVVLAILVTFFCHMWVTGYLTRLMLVAMCLLLFIGFFLILGARDRRLQNWFLAFCMMGSLVAGGMVNPIQKGVDVLYENALVKEISTITHEDEGEGLWIVEGSGILVAFPTVVGAPTINSVNVYPDLERWHILDPERKYEEIYNRYAHITIALTEEATRFELQNPDHFTLHLNYGDIEKLGIRYIVTRNQLSAQMGPVSFERLAQESGYNIYQANFS